jgi:hypothetical protein
MQFMGQKLTNALTGISVRTDIHRKKNACPI